MFYFSLAILLNTLSYYMMFAAVEMSRTSIWLDDYGREHIIWQETLKSLLSIFVAFAFFLLFFENIDADSHPSAILPFIFNLYLMYRVVQTKAFKPYI